ncbi:MAG: YraN family protein, partial [Muribaculaceae bacterium]|nr:YraN family protein [Muribaculaceae bacterium]
MRFRDELKRLLDNPPGIPGTEKIYGYTILDEFSNPSFFCNEDGTVPGTYLPEEERLLRRQFANAWGRYAEALTCRYLIEKGYPIREIDWRPITNKKGPGMGEIDIITQKDNRIIFIEVKARCGRHSDPWESITLQKRNRLCRGADTYLKMQQQTFEYQFDIALYTGNFIDYTFEYIEDAFLAPLRT